MKEEEKERWFKDWDFEEWAQAFLIGLAILYLIGMVLLFTKDAYENPIKKQEQTVIESPLNKAKKEKEQER